MARPRKAAADRRTEIIAFRFKPDEYTQLEAKAVAADMSPSEFCRRAALSRKIEPASQVPAINREAWAELAKAASNLNQAVAGCNANGYKAGPSIKQLQAALQDFRRRLLGIATS